MGSAPPLFGSVQSGRLRAVSAGCGGLWSPAMSRSIYTRTGGGPRALTSHSSLSATLGFLLRALVPLPVSRKYVPTVPALSERIF